MPHSTLPKPSPQNPPLAEVEILRWDGQLVTFPADIALDPPAGPVMVSVTLSGGPVEPVDTVHQPMARIPTVIELLQLVATVRARWDRRQRRVIVVRARSMEELEARAAWGDR